MVEGTSKFNEDFIKNYNNDINEGYYFEVDVQYLENLNNFYNDLHFLSERMKTEKLKKLVANLHNKREYKRLQLDSNPQQLSS